jgi:hypothetical protein
MTNQIIVLNFMCCIFASVVTVYVYTHTHTKQGIIWHFIQNNSFSFYGLFEYLTYWYIYRIVMLTVVTFT